MEKIIQLTEKEYDKLFEQANIKHSEIVKRAEKMYQERGTYGIHLRLDIKEDYYDNISFKADSYVIDWENKFPISMDDKRKIVEFVDEKALEMMQKKFGRQISSINLWRDRVKSVRSWKLKFIGWTLFGWVAALALLITNILK